jgi:rhamnogalacturonan endolyase
VRILNLAYRRHPLPPLSLISLILLGLVVSGPAADAASRQIERLDRGLVAVPLGGDQAFVSWRLLVTDATDVAFHVYRSEGRSPAARLTSAPLTRATSLIDENARLGDVTGYFVRPVIGGSEGPPSPAFVLPAGAPARAYLPVPLQVPPGGTTPDGVSYTYSANDCSPGDLDGDGTYEIVVKWDPSNAKDNSQSGHTGNVYLDAYRLDGTRLWRIDLGRNIRAGAHYTQFMVYDLDGDGRAEVACRTADGTVDGRGTVIGSATADHRNSSGYILTGPEFLTVFDGPTGAALATADYVPARGSVASWGDSYGNRVDRFLAAVAHLDGVRPSLVMCRGYYTRAVLAAWDWRDGRLTRRWVFDSDGGTPGNLAYRGEGNHNLSVADVDGDGRDEIVYGGCTIDDDGRGLYATGLKHGDALHVGDFAPDRPGLEVWSCHEDVAGNGGIGLSFRDARTGERIFTVPNTTDTGRAVAIDIDPRHRGAELWGSVTGLYAADGARISATRPSSVNFAVWWDGDLLREILDSNRIDKWSWTTGTTTRLLTATDCTSNNGTKATPALSADLFGDWREEVVWRTTDSRELRIFTTTLPTEHRFVTLMQDPQYRLAVAWQNVAYNQPPHPGFHLGEGMTLPPSPLVRPAAETASARLSNLSARTLAGDGEATLIAGFTTTGGETPVLMRAVGPTLGLFGVPGAAPDPRLTLQAAGRIMAANDDWSLQPDASGVAAAAARTGAFPLPAGSRDAALVERLAPGGYTAHIVAGAAGAAPGVALVEIYALAGSAGRLANLSTRARAGTAAETLILGFVLEGAGASQLLVRAVGPGLAPFGVGGVLADPRLQVFRGTDRLAENDDWEVNSRVSAVATSTLGAFALPAGSKDAALLLTLSPGAYTVQVDARTSAGGIALVELYDASAL